jgi:type III restriction enzyme
MTHPTIGFDPGLIEEISARLDLRTPNEEALSRVAERFETSAGEPFEAVLDLATGVGKTYIAAGLIDYLAEQGVRHFIIVTPGRTIQNKTIANFTAGHPKSLVDGMRWKPTVITADDFASGSVRSALDDRSTVKLFVFNVQQLIAPTQRASRRVRKFQEHLGVGLYNHLRSLDDLVVIGDEYHVYQEKATAFRAAVAELDAMAIVGLTATPTREQESLVIYRYELAHAIRDKLVKTPVLVGRKDASTDTETRLSDGLRLLDAKRRAVEAWTDQTGRTAINPVMFVVCDNIDNANEVSAVLNRLLDDYEHAVLTIHSDAPDDALARLDAAEDPNSPVRVIVSVSMLKEGWDVKNIFVICSLRPSIADALTEQTLGRGLRLPWGSYTGIELLDTVEVLSHERYGELLERAGVLLEGLVPVRAATPLPPAAPGPIDTGAEVQAANPDPTFEPDAAANNTAGDQATPRQETDTPVEAESAEDEDFVGAVRISTTEDRADEANSAVEALEQPIEPPPGITIELPDVQRIPRPRHFTLSDIPNEDFEKLGRQLSGVSQGDLRRKVFRVVEIDGQLDLTFEDAQDRIQASVPNLPLEAIEQALTDAMFRSGLVEQTRQNLTAAQRLIGALIRGAGGESARDHLSVFTNDAADMVSALVKRHYNSLPTDFETVVRRRTFRPRRLGRPVASTRHGAFSRRHAYGDWKKSVMPIEWFDSAPERSVANLLDDDPTVEKWIRLHRGEFQLAYDGGNYNPDFYVLAGGKHWLLEVKADREMANTDVAQKGSAAEQVARVITDHGELGEWRYALVSEEAIRQSHGNWAVLLARAGISS